MRLLRLAVAYERYLANFYQARPGLSKQPYKDQMDAINFDGFPGASDGLMAELEKLGYTTESHVVNARAAQEAWASEAGIARHTAESMWATAEQQVLRYAPEILIINPYVTPRAWVKEMRTRCQSIRLVIGRFSSPVQDLSIFESCDLVLSGDRHQVTALRAQGIDGAHLHHGFDTRILERTRPTEMRSELFFAGGLRLTPGFHIYRGEVVLALLSAGIPMDLRLLSDELTVSGRWKARLRSAAWMTSRKSKMAAVVMNRVAPLRRLSQTVEPPPPLMPKEIRRRASGPLFGLSLYQRMRKASMQLNVHGDVSTQEANNLRLWEATGLGSCLLTDSKSNLKELFTSGVEVVTFESVEDCVEKATWLVENPGSRAEIGRAGQARTLNEHTLGHRAVEMAALLEKRL